MNTPTILIVEDDADLSRALALRLRSEGFRVLMAQDAYRAVALARKENPTVILMDVSIPAGNGFMVHELLNVVPDFLTPVIYMSGGSVQENERRARMLGAAYYLAKPIDPNKLLECIQRCIAGYPHIEGAGATCNTLNSSQGAMS